jgi:hypothetical protein
MNLLVTRKDFAWVLINEDTGVVLFSGTIEDVNNAIKKLKVLNLKYDV